MPKSALDCVAQIAAGMSDAPDVAPLALQAQALAERAFAGHDSQFPMCGCSTLVGVVPASATSVPVASVKAIVSLVVSGAKDLDAAAEFGVLALLGWTSCWPSNEHELKNLARQLLWFETNSQLPALCIARSMLDRDKKRGLSSGLSQVLQDDLVDSVHSTLSRGEQYAAAAWIRSLDAIDAAAWAPGAMAGILQKIPLAAADSAGLTPVGADAGTVIEGTLSPMPRGPLGTAIAAFTGWLLVRVTFRWIAGALLAYRARAQIRVTDAGLEINEQKSVLARQVRERRTVIAIDSLRRLARETRYSRVGTYAGLAALAIGSFVGMRLFVDGLRVPGMSIQLLWLGLLFVLGGLLADFALSRWLDATRGRCQLIVMARQGHSLCLGGVDPHKVDMVLNALASRLSTRPPEAPAPQ
jgi:hypothetical protein